MSDIRAFHEAVLRCRTENWHKLKLLVYCSVYPPDPAAVGQYMADVAGDAARRGHRVRVITADRGYNDPSVRFPKSEMRQAVEVVRLRWSSFGKKDFFSRALGQIFYMVQGLIKGMLGFRPDVVLVSTIPPIGIFAAWLLTKLRRSSLIYWVMDINPDEAIAMGLVRPYSVPARLMESINRVVLRSARAVITLDSHMARRLESKIRQKQRILVIPPWPHEEILRISESQGQVFRKKHGLEGRFVVMYSGNLSWVHPLDSILHAASLLVHREDIVFLFIGGGNEKWKVQQAIQNGAPNIRSLPYQNFENLGGSLSAANVHVVVMGEAMVGIVHPCKIYGAMAVKRPLLAIAPDRSYISEIMDGRNIGFRLHNGDVNGVVQAIMALADMDERERVSMGEKAGVLVRTQWNQVKLRKKFVDLIEKSALP